MNEFGLCKSQGLNRKKVAYSDKIIEGARRKPVCKKKKKKIGLKETDKQLFWIPKEAEVRSC